MIGDIFPFIGLTAVAGLFLLTLGVDEKFFTRYSDKNFSVQVSSTTSTTLCVLTVLLWPLTLPVVIGIHLHRIFKVVYQDAKKIINSGDKKDV